MYLLLKEEDETQVSIDQAESEETEEEWERTFFLCAGCRSRITRQDAGIDVHDQHKHVFINPHGLVFEVGCFSWAINCVGAGPSTWEFTWFPGYMWQITVCLQCLTHLGWIYEAPDGDYFYGFILDRLVEESSNHQ